VITERATGCVFVVYSWVWKCFRGTRCLGEEVIEIERADDNPFERKQSGWADGGGREKMEGRQILGAAEKT